MSRTNKNYLRPIKLLYAEFQEALAAKLKDSRRSGDVRLRLVRSELQAHPEFTEHEFRRAIDRACLP
jgi:hypothetical protein